MNRIHFSIAMINFTANNKRIATNTILLYIRMLVIMVISLYTSRVILASLGVTDYGLYNVVGGVVSMFIFINSAMASSTQRYLTFSLANGDVRQMQKVFGTSLIIHLFISILILLLCETLGIWFIINKLVIPADRINAAFWTFQLSTISTIVVIMSVPYNATIIAHEKMSAFAYISIIEVLFKLAIAFLISWGSYDRLILYALLILIVQIIIRGIYGFYCKRNFPETKFKQGFDKSLFKEMSAFASWNLWGQCAAVAFTQGLNILLNIFFGPVINAAKAISGQVQGAVTQFSYNFQTAMNPQIVKSYASGELGYMHSLIIRSSKITFYLLLLLSLPILLNTDFILTIWLKEYPEYTSTFVRLTLLISMIDGIANSLMASAMATGKIRLYQGVIGSLLLCILPISYFVLRAGGNPVSVFVVHLCVCVIAFIIRLIIISPLVKISIEKYFKEVIFRCFAVMLIAAIVPTVLTVVMPNGIISFLTISGISLLSICMASYFCGLSENERVFIRNCLRKILKQLS